MWCKKYGCWCHEKQCNIDPYHCEDMINAVGEGYHDYEDKAMEHVKEHVKKKGEK